MITGIKEKRQAVISHAVTKGLNPDAPMKDSGVEWLGEVPEHWDVASIRRFLLEHRQGYYTTEPYIEDGVKLLRITDLRDLGEVSTDNCPKVPEHSSLSNYYLKEGDVVFARTGGAGSFGVIPKITETLAYASYLIRFRFIPEHFNTDYQRFMLIADSFQLAVKSNIHGGVNQNIHAEDIKDTFVCCPPLKEQQFISEFLNDVCVKYNLLIDKATQQIELMNERKIALISAAVTGKIDVRDWQGEA
jgi:type I restriction enzyme S subunit